jgi:hypothetical protein
LIISSEAGLITPLTTPLPLLREEWNSPPWLRVVVKNWPGQDPRGEVEREGTCRATERDLTYLVYKSRLDVRAKMSASVLPPQAGLRPTRKSSTTKKMIRVGKKRGHSIEKRHLKVLEGWAKTKIFSDEP